MYRFCMLSISAYEVVMVLSFIIKKLGIWQSLESAYCESFNGAIRNGLLDGEIFYSVKEVKKVQIVVGQ